MTQSHIVGLLIWLLNYIFRIFTLFTKSLPLDVACRVWDVFCRDGEEFLFRTALGKNLEIFRQSCCNTSLPC